MAYTKTTWVAREGTNLNKFAKSGETSTSVLLTNTPDAVSQQGTPFSAENMNKIEQGIADAHQGLNDLSSDLRWKADSGPWGPRISVSSGTPGWYSLCRILDARQGIQYKLKIYRYDYMRSSPVYLDIWIRTQGQTTFLNMNAGSLNAIAEIHSLSSFPGYFPLGIIMTPATSGNENSLDIAIVAYLSSLYTQSAIVRDECLIGTEIVSPLSYDLTPIKIKDDATPNSPPPGFWYINQAVFSYAPSAISANSPVVMRFSSVQSSPLQ
jgi:hypothetical protein